MYNEAKALGMPAAYDTKNPVKSVTVVDEVNGRLLEMNRQANDLLISMESFFSRCGVALGGSNITGGPEPETIGFQCTDRALTNLQMNMNQWGDYVAKLAQIA